MPRFFTLQEARQELPRVGKCIRDACSSKSQYEESDGAMQSLIQRIMIMGGILVDRTVVESIKSQRERSADRLKTALEEIQDVGCVVKDLDIGLVDFPTLFRGEEVYLCWRMDEPDIEFWHGVHEGFQGRKAIDRDFMDHHQGSDPN
ncbi:MAG: DUF2203 domain-containing protein [Bryobacteraceae bacterium]